MENKPEALQDSSVDMSSSDPTDASSPSASESKSSAMSGMMGKLGKKTLVIVGVVVALVAAAGFGFYQFVYLSPERVLDRAIGKMESIKSVAFAGKVSFNMEQQGSSASPFAVNSITVEFDGKADLADKETPKTDTDLDIRASGIGLAKGSLRSIGQVFYFNVTDISGLETILGAGGQGVFSSVTNKWVEVDPEKLAEMSKAAGSSAFQVPSFDPNKMTMLLRQNNPFKIKEKLEGEQLDGQTMFHYSYEIDKANYKKFMIEYVKLFSEGGKLEGAAEEELAKSVDEMEVKDGEIWIGTGDNFIHKVVMGFSSKSESGTTGIGLELTAKDYNQPVSIDAPGGAVPLEQFILNLNTILGGAPVF